MLYGNIEQSSEFDNHCMCNNIFCLQIDFYYLWKIIQLDSWNLMCLSEHAAPHQFAKTHLINQVYNISQHQKPTKCT